MNTIPSQMMIILKSSKERKDNIMYEEEKNIQQVNDNESGTGTTAGTGQRNENKTANTNPYNNYSNGTFSGQNTYGSQNTYNSGSGYGAQSYGSSSGYGSQSSYGTGSTYGSTAGGCSYGSGTGNGYGSTNGYNYTYGQSSYSYNQNAQPGYGTYQYNTSNISNQPPQTPPKKKHTALKVVAAICAVALVVGGVGFTYNAVTRRSGLFGPATGEEDRIEQQETQGETKEETIGEEASNDKEIETTTVTGETKAVVTDVTSVVEEVMPAMVMIHNNYTASASYFGFVQQEEATASGSGIIVGENESELLIATNYHVIEGADSLEVIFTDDKTVEAVVKGTDSDMDLAVIAVMLSDIPSDTKDTIKIATLGDSTALKLGEPAIAIGNALGYGQSVTTGVISAVNRDVELEDGTTQTFIQTDAAINPGNSGGALLNLQGEVIGINSNKIGGDTIEGMGYAIPISVAQPIIDKLMNEETKLKVASADRGYIGISGVSVTAEVAAGYGIPRGVYVAEVSKGGGAEAAGLEKGDVITEFDGQEITSMDDLQTRLQYYAAGTEVTIKVMRQDGQEYTERSYNVTLGRAAGSSSSEDTNPVEENEGQQGIGGFQMPGFPGVNGFYQGGEDEEGGH